MNAETIAWIIVQAINAGVDMAEIAENVNESGEVDPGVWQQIADDVSSANAAWDNADPK